MMIEEVYFCFAFIHSCYVVFTALFYGGKRETAKVYHEENERSLTDGDEFVKVCS
jgi:hypothetical protein